MKTINFKPLLASLMVMLVSVSASAETYSGTCGVNWSLDTETGILSITGTGPMNSYNTNDNYNSKPYDYGSSAPWNYLKSYILSVTIGEGVTSIGDCAFRGCAALITIDLPSTITSIGAYAFSRCTGALSIDIPDGVTSIGEFAFFESNFKSITIGSGITSLSNSTFAGCRKLKTLIIPDGVTSMEKNVFCACEGMTSISLPEGLTNISETAFENCYKLQSITIPSTVTSIEKSAFRYCFELTSIIIPQNVESIGERAFVNCNKLESVTIEGCKNIGNDAFSGCTSLESITLPDNLISVGNSAFYKCESLDSLFLPSSVTSIGGSAFDYCNNLSAVTIWKSTPPTLGSHNYSNFSNATLYVANGRKSSYTSATNWSNFKEIIEVLRPGDIFTRTISGNLNMTFTVISETACQVGNSSSACVSSVLNASVTIPAEIDGFKVTTIAPKAFFTFSQMTSVTIPSSVDSIGTQAFWGCSSLANIVMESPTPPTISSNSFSYYDDVTVHVPAGSSGQYKQADYWNNFVIEESGEIVIKLVDGEKFEQSKIIRSNTLTYTRTYENTDWQAWYVPFDLTLTSDVLEDFSFAKFAGTNIDEEGALYISIARMKEGDVVKANTPYFVQAKAASTEPQVITLTDATLYAAQEKGFQILSVENMISVQGIYSEKEATDTDHSWYAFDGEKFAQVTTGQTLAPYRFFLTLEEREDSPYATASNPTEIMVRMVGEESGSGSTLPGDMNNDGRVSITDVGIIIDYILNDDGASHVKAKRQFEPKPKAQEQEPE